ncbi:C40 family peptidase [Christiangramia sabulilitoris]|uniref:NlpC/P60 family protein n=1 Tax=Christiangramia sabulilitoris TaxID=2583991 RepID=A0A550I7Y3_9FLAO|nr:C40 family peptidase [Christiangramia sabulilitoris]TRO67077.1 NlpC/P60 family protein [Christiangramia sabulilitoris]
MSFRSCSKYCLYILMIIMLASCGSSRNRVITRKKDTAVVEKPESEYKHDANAKPNDKVAYKIIKNAKKFEGTRYKYGGTDKRGMDCSGLVYISFLEEGISLPRTSRSMSLRGDRLFLKEVRVGDLLFFETNKNRKVINHVGLVVEVNADGIFFIHSSSSRGVIISSLSEPYWQNNFVMARRVI